jgi:hypothetical protein
MGIIIGKLSQKYFANTTPRKPQSALMFRRQSADMEGRRVIALEDSYE